MKKNRNLSFTFSNLNSNKILKWVLIPTLLLILWFFLSLLYSSYKSFTVLQYVHISNGTEKKLFAGEGLVGEFVARENNLGIIAVKFNNVPRVDYIKEDELLFRIKEKNSTKWIAENKYKAGLIDSESYFTFGFIPITDSLGKAYIFEISSLKGNHSNSVSIDVPVNFISKYKFSIAEITEDRNSILDFAGKKILTFFSNYDVVISSSIFLLPLAYYVTVLFVLKYRNYVLYKGLKFKDVFFSFSAILIIADILFFDKLITGFVLGLLGFWAISVYINNQNSKRTYAFAFIIAGFTTLSINYKPDIIDGASVYVYLLLILGLFQDLRQEVS